MDHIELAAAGHCRSRRRETDVEVVRWKCRAQLLDLFRSQIDDDVDVMGCSRLAIGALASEPTSM
jgi:hypothetical protein